MTHEEKLESLGFRNKWEDENGAQCYPYGEYYDEQGNKKVCLKGDGLYAYSVDKGYMCGEPSVYLELRLNFLPDVDMMEYLVRRVFYIS